MRTVSFSFYQDIYHGALTEEDFNRQIYHAGPPGMSPKKSC